MNEKYYKVIAANGLSPTKSFNYSDYLPKDGKPGKWLPEIKEAEIRKSGYYASKYWNMWYVEGARIYEVEAENVFKSETPGVEKQICCAKMRLLRDVTEELLATLPEQEIQCDSSGKAPYNTGIFNTGIGNTGSYNPGNFNTGNRNTGNLNRGDFNTGDSNSGIDNVGDNNDGSGNVGCNNTGHSNTGSFNIGSFNTGDFNCGYANCGSFNKGNRNVGNWNIGSYNAGFFNTTDACVRMFNKPTNLKISQVKIPKWLNYKDPKKAFLKAEKGDVILALKLPNFDFEIFEKLTGISKLDFQEKLGSDFPQAF